MSTSHSIDCDAAPLVPPGWRVEKHIAGGKVEWDPKKVALYLSKGQQGGNEMRGDQLRGEFSFFTR